MAEAIGIASGIAGLVTLAMKVTELSYGYISDIRSAQSTQKQYLRELSALTDVLLHGEEALQGFQGSGLAQSRSIGLSDEAVTECLEQLEYLQFELTKPSPTIFWPLKEKSLKKHVEALHRFRGIFSDFLSSQSLKVVSATHREVTRLGQHQDHSKLLEWYGGLTETPRPVKNPLEGTGKWFLQSKEYREWLSGTASSTILWCHGPPGVGKSVLASTAIRHLIDESEEETSCVIYYFFDFANRHEQTKDNVWRALLAQALAQGRQGVFEQLNKLRERQRNSQWATSNNLFEALLTICSSHQVILVIDGPDEMENTRDFKVLLGPFLKASSRILVTSRDIPEVRNILENGCTLAVQADDKDLRAYVASRFRESDLEDILERYPDLETEIVTRANNIFLIAKLLVDDLVEQTTVKQMRRAIQAYSSHLDQAFESSLERINAQTGTQKALAQRVMGWITTARRRLRLSELIHGLATEDGSQEIDKEDLIAPKTISKVCGGLVIVDVHQDMVGMVHSTVYTWYQQRNSTIYDKDMARSCLRYLKLRPLASGMTRTVEEMDKRMSDMPFLGYSSEYWRVHLKDQGDAPEFADEVNLLFEDPKLLSAAFQAMNYRHQLKEMAIKSETFNSMPSNHTALHMAAYWGLDWIVAQMLEERESVDAVDSQKWTPLHWASFGGSHDVVSRLVSHGALLDAKDSSGWTPLFWAALNGNARMTKTLLDKGANLWERDKHGWTALRWAVAREHTDVLKVMIEHPSRTNSAHQKPPLEILRNMSLDDALRFNDAKEAQEDLLQDLVGDTADTSSTDVGSSQTVENLFRLLYEASVNVRDLWKPGYFDEPVGNAWRTLRKAERIGGFDYYIDHYDGYRKPRSSKTWKTGLVHTAIRDDNITALKLLIEVGADVNGGYVRTPLHAATFRQDPQFAEVLLGNGAEIESLDGANLTPLQQAVLNGFEEVVRLLVSKGASVNARVGVEQLQTDSAYGSGYRSKPHAASLTPLMLALGLKPQDDDPELPARLVRLLLDAGADVHTVNDASDGMTVIHYAAASGNQDLLRMVVEAGADTRALDSRGRTSVHHLVLGNRLLRDEYREDDDGKCIPSSLTDCLLFLKEECGPEYLSRPAEWTEIYWKELNYGAYMDSTHSPLSLAILLKSWELFHALLGLGAGFETNLLLSSLIPGPYIALQTEVVNVLVENGARFPDDAWWITRVKVFEPGLTPTRKQIGRFSAILEKLMPVGLNINAFGAGHSTLLHQAVTKEGSPDLTRELLRLGADPAMNNKSGLDSFMLALLSGSMAILRVLLDHARKHPCQGHWTQHMGGDFGTASDRNLTKQICEALEKAGVINLNHMPTTILCEAATRGLEDMVVQLLQHGADSGLTNESGGLPIHFAAAEGHVAIVRRLIESEVDMDQVDSKGQTALHLAAEGGHAEVVGLLLGNEAKPDVADAEGWHPVHYAALRGHAEVAQLLARHGAPLSTATLRWSHRSDHYRPAGIWNDTPWTGTPLHLAVMSGNLQLVKVLLESETGVDVNARADNYDLSEARSSYRAKQPSPGSGPLALHCALDTGRFHGKPYLKGRHLDKERLEIAMALVEHGADVTGVADHLDMKDLEAFRELPELWNRLRVGLTVKTGPDRNDNE